MSEISLREYLSDLDRLLNQHAADDVILHSRHILQYYPKIVDAYRFLGRALILNGRWDEAEAALRRVIAVIPDDYHAHVGLSEIYDRNRRGAEAIWHLERALEQNPNQSELITALRSLYKRYRNIDQAKVPMTAGAVARQAMANQSYEQAIETLRSALVRHKDRIDLRLLLAESLWAGSDPVESAEAAMDVLESLPDCLSANAIMTRLWLQEGRSSDAQRYLNRVEAVAPYLAVEIATNRPVDDDAFHIEKLDVKRSAQAELALNRPDWLQDISPESAAAQAAAEEWSSWSPAESGLLAATGTASKQDDPAPEWPPDAQTAEQSAVSLFEFEQESDVLVEGDSDSDLPEWMNAPTMQVPLSQLQAASAELSEEDDELSWLQAAENALTDDEIPSDELLFGVSDELAAQAESNGMDWLKDFEEDDAASAAESAEIPDWMIDDPLPVRSIPTPDLTDAPLPELAQDFDWAANDQFLDEALGIENLASGAPAPAEESPATIEELDWFAGETTLAQSTEESPADTTSNLGLTDIFNDPGFDPFAASPETPYDPYAETAPETGEPVEIVAEDDEWLDQVSNESAGVPGPKRGLTSLLKDANFDWMNEETSTELPSAVDQTMDDWTKQFDPAPEKADDNPAWLGTIESAETLDMAQQPDLQNEAGLTPPIQEASPTEIINPSALQSETASSSPSDDFDWANVEEIPASEGLDESAYPALDVLLGTGAAAASVDNILSDDESPVEAEPISESDLDWLSEVGVTVEESQAGESVTASEEELAALFGGADNQPQPEAGESELDWLGELDSTLTEQLEAESSADREDDLEALFATAETEIADEQAAAGESELNWLGELDSTLTEQLEAESSADREDDLEALFATAETEIADEQAAAGESELDWLSELDSTLTEQLEAESSADREDDLEALFATAETEIADEQAAAAQLPEEILPADAGDLAAIFGAEEPETASDAEFDAVFTTATAAGLGAAAFAAGSPEDGAESYADADPAALPEIEVAEIELDWLSSEGDVAEAVEDEIAKTAISTATEDVMNEFGHPVAEQDDAAAGEETSQPEPASESEDTMNWWETPEPEEASELQPEAELQAAEVSIQPSDEDSDGMVDWFVDAELDESALANVPELETDPEDWYADVVSDEEGEAAEETSYTADETQFGVRTIHFAASENTGEYPDWLEAIEETDHPSETEEIPDEDVIDESVSIIDFIEVTNVISEPDDNIFADDEVPQETSIDDLLTEEAAGDNIFDEDTFAPETAFDEAPLAETLSIIPPIEDDGEDESFLNDEPDEISALAGAAALGAVGTVLAAQDSEQESPFNDEIPETAAEAIQEEVAAEVSDAPVEAAAENAPDWLNAMVPGLDVDYEAEEDQPIETEYLESEPETVLTPDEIAASEPNWLEEMIAQEERESEAILEAAAGQESQFKFSRFPLWYKPDYEENGAAPDADGTADDDNLPEWLR